MTDHRQGPDEDAEGHMIHLDVGDDTEGHAARPGDDDERRMVRGDDDTEGHMREL